MASRKKRLSLKQCLINFQLSGAYPLFFAAVCAISGMGDKRIYLPAISILAISILFSIFCVKDNKVFLAPILMSYYSLGTDRVNGYIDSNGNVTASFDQNGFIGICFLAAIIIIPLIFRFILDGSFVLAIRKKSLFLFGILALDAAILLGGLFSKHWNLKSIFYGIVLIAGLNIFFLMLSSIVKKCDKDIFPYTCRILILTCLVISAQVIVAALRAHAQNDLVIFSTSMDRWLIQRSHFSFSWGLPTIVGASAIIGIPAAFYLAKNERYPALYYCCALLFWGVSFIVNTRSAMIVGAFFLLIGAVIASCSGKNKKTNLFLSVVLGAGFLAAAAIFCARAALHGNLGNLLTDAYKLFRFDSVYDRIRIFKAGLGDFVSYPVFGVGWSKGALETNVRTDNFYGNMYHCIIIQLGASTGVVGITAFVYHFKDIAILAIKQFRADRLLLLAVPIMILSLSLVDNFIFYLNFQIIYAAFLVLAERHCELSQ